MITFVVNCNYVTKYLLNELLHSAVMSADNVRKIRIWPRSKASRALVKFEENVSAKDVISRHTRNQNGVYLFDNSPINFQISP